jgi:hypothetical protein
MTIRFKDGRELHGVTLSRIGEAVVIDHFNIVSHNEIEEIKEDEEDAT